jgi:hypothetical protein
MILGSSVDFAATGNTVWRGEEIYLIIDETFGTRAPALGDEILMPWVLRPGPGGYAILRWSETTKGFSGIPLPTDRMVRYFHHPESGWGNGYTFDEYCEHSRPVADVLEFYASIDFDAQVCYDEVIEALDILDGQSLNRNDSGCSGAGVRGGWWVGWMTLLLHCLGSRLRFRRECDSDRQT